MKFLRVATLLMCCSSYCFAVNKDLVQLQRDLEDKINAVQNDLDTKLAALTGMVTAMQSDTRRTADQVATLQESVGANVAKSLTPVAGLGVKVDNMGDEVRSLKDTLADLSARLERMDAKMTDLKNQLQVMQSPPPAPAATPLNPGGSSALLPNAAPAAVGSGTPPMGMSADKSYNDAATDLQTGKTDLAYNEFQQYLTYYPNTELAANAQYYIGEIDYNRGKYPEAVKAFDSVLERYPNNPKTSDAHLMKAYALLKSNQRNRAVQEFRVLVARYPNSDNSRRALQQLRALGAPPATASRGRG
jgi:tol-pal system protein YbgF